MNFLNGEKLYCLFVLLFLIHFTSSAQKPGSANQVSSDIYDLMLNEFGSDPVLVNGIYPEDYYRNALGHPFLGENKFSEGSITVHNKLFDNIRIKFNIYDQQVIILTDGNAENPVEVIPPNRFISGFSINDLVFRKLKDEGKRDKFFQVVFDGEIKCLYHWEKERVESFHNARIRSYRFNEQIRKSYLLIDNKLYVYKSFGSFLNLFPNELKPDIRTFCKNERINFSTANDRQTAKLIEFCEGIMVGSSKKQSASYNKTR